MLHPDVITSAAGDSETPQVANQLLISMAGTSPFTLGQLDADVVPFSVEIRVAGSLSHYAIFLS
jgi:hypothetical protein